MKEKINQLRERLHDALEEDDKEKIQDKRRTR